LEQARVKVSALLSARNDASGLHELAAKILAELGEKDSALAEAKQAVTLLPLSKNPRDGLEPLETLAEVYATFGDAEHALPLLQQLLKTTGAGILLTPVLLKLDPVWGPIRNTPAFQKLFAQSDSANHL
jgi:tetratricopeptide (TPR) repeat protein